MITAEQIIQQYKLLPHPEGGYYKQTYISEETIPASGLPERFSSARHFSTAIYFLLGGTDFSAFHRIKSDELWHFYAGEGLHIYVIHPGGEVELLKLGNDLSNGYSFQHVVKAGCWFASQPVTQNSFSLVGCTVAPGFDFADFEMGERNHLLETFPQHQEWISRLCR